jgi:hypothetical protein
MLSGWATPSAPRNRLGAMACAVLGTAALTALGGQDRAWLQYAVVLTLGYGHLLGGALSEVRRLAGARNEDDGVPGRRLATRFIGAVAALGLVYAGYLAAVETWPVLVLLLLAIATLHTVENDLALADAYARGLRLPPVSLRGSSALMAAGFTALVLALATACLVGEAPGPAGSSGPLPGLGDAGDAILLLRFAAAGAGSALLAGPGAWRAEAPGLALVAGSAAEPGWLCAATGLAFSDLFSALTLYHLASWWILSGEKAHRPGGRRGAGREVLSIHAVPVLVLGMALVLGGGALHSAFFAPAPYLFWSMMHAIQTAWGRRIRAPGLLPTC